MTDPRPSQRPTASEVFEKYLKDTPNLFEAQSSNPQG